MPNKSSKTQQWILLGRRYGVTVKELAEELEIGLKIIRRGLTMLQSAGLPFDERPGSTGPVKVGVTCSCGPNARSVRIDKDRHSFLHSGRKVEHAADAKFAGQAGGRQ